MEYAECHINAIISDYFKKKHLPEVQIAYGIFGFNYFYYRFETNEVNWTLLTAGTRQDRNLNLFFEEILGCRPCHRFIYSLFHEYGHAMTMSNFSDRERTAYFAAKNYILQNVKDKDTRDFAYFNLPLERAASEWAVKYINEHYDELVEWANEILFPAIDEMRMKMSRRFPWQRGNFTSLRYKYTLYGRKKRYDNVKVHPITIHSTKAGAYISLLLHLRQYKKLSVV